MSRKQHSISVRCPVCQGQMNVRELECTDCKITVRGDFGAIGGAGAGTGRFDALTPEQMVFLETFLRCRGVIRDVEAALGISYPTVRARLDALLSALGFGGAEAASGAGQGAPSAPAAEKPSLKDILSRLDSGAIDAQSALDAIRGDSQDGAK